MKNLYVIGIMFWWGVNCNAQALYWEWVETGDEFLYTLAAGNGICTDANGNIYVTGSCQGDSFVLGGDILTNIHSDVIQAIFITKYDASGNAIWVKSAWSVYTNDAQAICTDAHGNVYVTGTFEGPSLILGNTDTLINPDQYTEPMFIIKYDSLGNLLWVRDAGGLSDSNTFSASGTGISADADGNVFITGTFEGADMIFGSDTLTNQAQGNDPNNIFIAKYDASGNAIWANNAAGKGGSICADGTGNCYVTGYFANSHIIVVKYDASGNAIWAQTSGGTYGSIGQGITTDETGNVYATGGFSYSDVTFGNDTLHITGAFNFFIVKYDASGNVIWAKNAGGNSNGSSICTDANGNIYITGYFSDSLMPIGTDTLINNTESVSIFVARYNASGSLVWAKSAGGAGNDSVGDYDIGTGISVDGNGNIYVTGSFNGPSITFGSITLNDSISYSDIFVAKIGNTPTGIPEISNIGGLVNVYPNPSPGAFYFTGVPTGATIEIYNVLGEMVLLSITGNSNYQLNLNSQAKGIYFYRVMDNSNFTLQSGKIVLE